MKKRVAIINQSFLNPTEIWIRRHIEALKKYYPIVIVHNRAGTNRPLKSGRLLLLDSWLWLIKPINLATRLLSKIPWYGYQLYFKITISLFRIRIVHIHFFWNVLWFFDYIKSVKIPVIVTAHGTDVNSAFADLAYQKRIVNVFNKVDKIICVSHFIKNKLIELGCPQEKLIVNYLGVPIVSFQRNENDKVGNIMRLICVAALRPEKGHEMLLEVFNAVLSDYPNCELVLIGDGPLRDSIQQQAIELSITEKVIFKGWQEQEDVFKFLSYSDIYVQCSKKYVVDGEICREEGIGISPLEAAMIGLPLVLTDVGGINEVCKNEYNGYLCPYGDILFAKEKILKLILSEDLRKKFSENSTVLVHSTFDQETNLRSLELIYEKVERNHYGGGFIE